MISVFKKRGVVMMLSLSLLLLTPLVGSQDQSPKVADVLRELRSEDWGDRRLAVGKIKADLDLFDEQEIQRALLGTCRELLDSLVTQSDHRKNRQLLADIVYLARRLRSPEALPCLMDLPMDNGWISVSWVKEVVESPSEPIIELLESGNVSQKSNAVRVLSSLHPDLSPFQREKVKTLLISYVGGNAENHDVRAAAIFGLVVYPEPEVVELLEQIATADPSWDMINGKKRYLLREKAVKVLEMIKAQ